MGREFRRRLCRLGRCESGAAMIEAALVLPVVLLLVAGIVMTGRVAQAQIAVQSVAREAARTAALAPSAADGLAEAEARALSTADGHGLDPARVALVIDVGSFERGGTVQVGASYPVSLGDLPLLGLLEVTVSADHEQTIERYRSRTVVLP